MKLSKLLHKPVNFKSELSPLMKQCMNKDCVVAFIKLDNFFNIIIIKNKKEFYIISSYKPMYLSFQDKKENANRVNIFEVKNIMLIKSLITKQMGKGRFSNFVIVNKKEYQNFLAYYLPEFL